MSDHKTFALAGAGQVGHAFAEEFVKDKNVSLKILTRIGSIGVSPPLPPKKNHQKLITRTLKKSMVC